MALLSHLGIEWDLTSVSPDELAAVAPASRSPRQWRPLIHSGEVVHGDLAQPGADLTGVVSADGRQASVRLQPAGQRREESATRTLLPGLDPAGSYRLEVHNPTGRADSARASTPGWMNDRECRAARQCAHSRRTAAAVDEFRAGGHLLGHDGVMTTADHRLPGRHELGVQRSLLPAGQRARTGTAGRSALGACVLLSVDFAEIEALQVAGEWEAAGDAAGRERARSVEAAGADLLVLCTNTMHKVADQVQAAVTIPLLHIVDVTAAALLDAGVSRVGLLGTGFTMEQAFYRDRLASHGLDVLVPDAGDRAEVHRIIYDELCLGVVTEPSREVYRGVIRRLVDAGAQAVILGCTEIELLVRPADSPVPVVPDDPPARRGGRDRLPRRRHAHPPQPPLRPARWRPHWRVARRVAPFAPQAHTTRRDTPEVAPL